jgi:hypothetical protein
MSEKIHCPTCGCVLSVTADEIIPLGTRRINELGIPEVFVKTANPCDTLTRQHTAANKNAKSFMDDQFKPEPTGTYKPALIPGCPFCVV